MRTILLAASGLLAVVACAPSTLVRVGEIESEGIRFVTYADRATIKKTLNTVRMSSVIDPEGPDDRRLFSWTDEWDYQCQDNLLQPQRYTQYSGRMGTGDRMYSHTVQSLSGSLPVVPGSVGEKLWQIACRHE
jgi:hypothetical protein